MMNFTNTDRMWCEVYWRMESQASANLVKWLDDYWETTHHHMINYVYFGVHLPINFQFLPVKNEIKQEIKK